MNNTPVDITFKPSPTAWLNLLRIFACLLVMLVHSGEFFYIGANGILRDHLDWVNYYGSFMRQCVPLFVMISGYLLLPIKEEPAVFYKKRFMRLLVPFIVWSVIYAIVSFVKGEYTLPQMFTAIATIPVNFSPSVGHLWFVYMLIGVYLFIPVISPWVQSASKQFKQFFLLIWVITLFFPYIKTIYPEILGEAFWNKYPAGYYFSGYIGYLVLGHYLKEYVSLSKGNNIIIGLILVIAGYIITRLVFAHQAPIAKDIPELELSWAFPTFNVAMMATGMFLLFRNITFQSASTERFVADVSGLTYGMYLAHILVLVTLFPYINDALKDIRLVIPVLAISTFVITYLLIKLLSFLPGRKYWVG